MNASNLVYFRPISQTEFQGQQTSCHGTEMQYKICDKQVEWHVLEMISSEPVEIKYIIRQLDKSCNLGLILSLRMQNHSVNIYQETKAATLLMYC